MWAEPRQCRGNQPWEMNLTLGFCNRGKERVAAMPPQSSELSLPQDDWTALARCFDEYQRSSRFYECPSEAETCYWCFPGGPAQWCACMLNPCTWLWTYGPQRSKKQALQQATAQILQAHGNKISLVQGLCPYFLVCRISPLITDGSGLSN